MSIIAPASLSFLVKAISAADGFRLPDGWLCPTIKLVATVFTPTENINRKSATVQVMPPSLTLYAPMTRLARFRYSTTMCSFRAMLPGGIKLLRTLYASKQDVISGFSEMAGR